MAGVGLKTLIAALITEGGPEHLDARNHRRLHETLVQLGRDLPSETLPALSGVPDPEVGLRVRGVTRALWDMHAAGALYMYELGSTAEYRVEFGKVRELAAGAQALPGWIREIIHRRAIDWSIAVETDLKNERQLC